MNVKSRISATKAARSLSEILDRVRYRGESFLVERAGEVVCEIVPAGPPRTTLSELVRALRAAPRPDKAWLDAVEKVTTQQPRLPADPWRR